MTKQEESRTILNSLETSSKKYEDERGVPTCNHDRKLSNNSVPFPFSIPPPPLKPSPPPPPQPNHKQSVMNKMSHMQKRRDQSHPQTKAHYQNHRTGNNHLRNPSWFNRGNFSRKKQFAQNPHFPQRRQGHEGNSRRPLPKKQFQPQRHSYFPMTMRGPVIYNPAIWSHDTHQAWGQRQPISGLHTASYTQPHIYQGNWLGAGQPALFPHF